MLTAQRKFPDAVEAYELALRINPNSAPIYNRLAGVMRTVGKSDEALSCLRKTIELRPDYIEAYINLGNLLAERGDHQAALNQLAHALLLKADHPGARFSRSLNLLRNGDFEEGWREYEWRWPCKDPRPRRFQKPRWSGESVKGRTVLLHYEQGYGDTLQFIRFAAHFKQQGAKVIVAVQKPLQRLLSTCPDVDQAYLAKGPLPPFDVWVPLLSVPGLIQTRFDSIPATVPYLFPPRDLITTWSRRIARPGTLRIGVFWQGNLRTNRLRSFPLSFISEFGQSRDVALYSLQTNPGREQLASLDQASQIVDLSDNLTDFTETAAAMMNLDLVITCDSAPAHLAGALGVPVWVALPFAADWRWFQNREDSPWYPTMRLFRQSKPGDWSGVFERIGGALEQRIRENRN